MYIIFFIIKNVLFGFIDKVLVILELLFNNLFFIKFDLCFLLFILKYEKKINIWVFF